VRPKVGITDEASSGTISSAQPQIGLNPMYPSVWTIMPLTTELLLPVLEALTAG